MSPALANELAARAADGWHPVTLSEIKRQLRDLGYALDRTLDCRSTAQIMTYPTLSTGIKEADTGRSAFHFEARRDANFRTLQKLRFEVGLYAVLNGAILDV